MTTAYPGAIDTLTNPVAGDQLDSVTVPHVDQHANANDAIEAIETELGVNPSGASATVVARLDALDTTVSNKIASGSSAGGGLTGTYPNPTLASGSVAIATLSATGTPDATTFLRGDNSWAVPSASVSWPLTASGYLDMNSNDIYGIDQLAVGAAVSTTTVSIARTVTGLTSTYSTFKANDALTWSSGGFFSINAFDIFGTYTLNGAPLLGMIGFQFRPAIAGTATAYQVIGISVSPSIASGTALTQYTGVSVSGGQTDTVTTVGLKMTSLTGVTKWGMQVGDYQSYHQGKLALGGTTAPTWALHLEGTAQDRGAIGLAAQAATPTSPASSSEGVVYVKGGKFVLAYNDAGTVRYKYLDLTGTGVTWVHTTTAP